MPPFAAILAVANNAAIPAVAEETITLDVPANGLPAGFLESRERRIGGVVVERHQFVNGFYEDIISGSGEKVLQTRGEWNIQANAVQVILKGRTGLAPTDTVDPADPGYTSKIKISNLTESWANRQTSTVERKEDSASPDIFKDISISMRTEGLPVRRERQLNGFASSFSKCELSSPAGALLIITPESNVKPSHYRYNAVNSGGFGGLAPHFHNQSEATKKI